MIRQASASDVNFAFLAAKSREAYSEVALEYYQAARHPTCANFAAIHDQLCQFFGHHAPAHGLVLEVGCGAGRLGRIRPSAETVLTDISEVMLELARRESPKGVMCERMNAFCPHFQNGTVASIFGFLGDAYNHPEFFRQAARILAPGGVLVFTLPNHQWAKTLRGRLSAPLGETTFVLDFGRTVTAPSITREVTEQAHLMAGFGFDLEFTRSFSLEGMPGSSPSRHVAIAAELLKVDPHLLPLVDVFVATRSAIGG